MEKCKICEAIKDVYSDCETKNNIAKDGSVSFFLPEETNIKNIFQFWVNSYQTWIIQLDNDFQNTDIKGHQYEIDSTEHDLKNKTAEQLFEPEMGIFESDVESYDLDMKSKQVLELKQDLIKENIKYLHSKIAWHKNEIEELT